MSKLEDLGEGWEVEGDAAKKGGVTVIHMDGPTIYRASAMSYVASDYECPRLALGKLRNTLVLMMELAQAEVDTIAETLADIDAPPPPDEEECQCKTAIDLESFDAGDAVFTLVRCQWECEKCWIEKTGVNMIAPEIVSLTKAGCPEDYWPKNCGNLPQPVIAWFQFEFADRVTP